MNTEKRETRIKGRQGNKIKGGMSDWHSIPYYSIININQNEKRKILLLSFWRAGCGQTI